VEEGRTRVWGDLSGAMGVKMTLTREDIVVVGDGEGTAGCCSE